MNFVYTHRALAQPQSNLGREFYVAFAANQGSDETSNVMALYITSPRTASGAVEVPALGFSQTFTTLPGKVTTVVLPSDQQTGTVELLQSEVVYTGYGVYITATDDIAVFGLNHKNYSSDAFMALPTSALGMSYRSINFPSSPLPGAETPGEFWMVATADNTIVQMNPNAMTFNGQQAGQTFEVTLNKGEAYMVQGDQLNSANDLTGSNIIATKPLAFFSGHQRTQIPENALNAFGSTSRNHLCEQIPPETAWGDSVIVIPFQSSTKPDLVRIISATGGNAITVNDTAVATLQAGGFYEIKSLTGPTIIRSKAPVLVGQYMHTSWNEDGSGGPPGYGDPCMSLVLPVEQFANQYTVLSFQSEAFLNHFLNIVVEQVEFAPLIYLDGKLIPQTAYTDIPNSFYKYAQISVSAGPHEIHSAQDFGLTVYGLGDVDGYTYTGGALVTPIGVQSVASSPLQETKRITHVSASSNPFAAGTTLSYELSKPTSIRYELLDEIGRVVQVEIHGNQSAGTHLISLEGSSLPAGFYNARFVAGNGEIASVKLRKLE
jgi:hypothetical protein